MTKRDYAKADAFFNNTKKTLLKLLKGSDKKFQSQIKYIKYLNKYIFGSGKKFQSKIYENLFSLHMGYITFNLERYKKTDKEISFEFFEDMLNILEEAKIYAETPDAEKLMDNIHIDLLTEYFKKTKQSRNL